ncbi:MAG: TIGR03905 family TSCPD domain-containing protein [Saccharofermentans sp.]|nr:TIGR03905 family TSCPD domain-containing protein [Saccharofermentans sp.]
MHYEYKTSGVCAVAINFDIEGDIISNVKFIGGCNGNLKAIAKLVDGKTADEINAILAGNTCGMKGTSCADQLAQAVIAAKNAN